MKKIYSKKSGSKLEEHLEEFLSNVHDGVLAFDDYDRYSDDEIRRKKVRILCDKESLKSIRQLSLEDYFGETVTGKNAKKTIQRAWKTSKREFVINEKTNELRYNTGNTFDADRLLKELPETLEGRKSREWVVMNLAEARKFFELDFKLSLIEKIKYRT